MSAKTVALDPEAYRLLRERKRPSETFSDVVKRIARPRRPLTDFIGIWAGDRAEAIDELETIRASLRASDLRRMTAHSKRGGSR